MQARVKTEAMKGKAEEREMMVAYGEELKDVYRQKKEKQGDSLNARRPWRATATIRRMPSGASATNGGGVARQILPYPETPEQKISRRSGIIVWCLLPL